MWGKITEMKERCMYEFKYHFHSNRHKNEAFGRAKSFLLLVFYNLY